MQPIHDVDVLLLHATAMAAKRRPAEMQEIMAAIDLIQRNIPSEEKLVDAFVRLGQAGLLVADGERVGLTPVAEGLIRILPRKGEYDQRLFELRGLLGAHQPKETCPAIVIEAATLRAAMQAHRGSAAGAGKNLLMPKPKPEAPQGRPGQRQRKPLPKARKH